MPRTYDVAVVGGGVIGSAVAYFLAKERDMSVAVIEPDPTYARASTPKATGVIRQQFSTPENIEMCVFGGDFLRSADDALSTAAGPARIDFRERGYLMMATEATRTLMAAMHATQLAHGADVIFLDAAELAQRFPPYRTEAFVGGYFGRTGAGWFDPWSLLLALRRKAIDLGATYLHDRVVALAARNRRVVEVGLQSGEAVSARHVVNAAGAHGAAGVAALLGVPLPVEPRRRCAFLADCREDVGGLPMTVLPNGVWFRPEGKGVLCGVAPDPTGDVSTDDDTVDHALFDEVIWPAMAEAVPALEAVKVTGSYAGFYDYNTLDENAILGPSPDVENFHLATGFSGHGVMQAPAAGRAVAELIRHGRFVTIDLTRFGYGRVLSRKGIHETACF